MAYSAMSPVYQNLVLQSVSYVCCMHPAVVAESYLPSVQSSAMALTVCCEQGLAPVLLVGHSGVTLALSSFRQGNGQRCSSTKLQGVFPVLSPEKLSLVGRACSQT